MHAIVKTPDENLGLSFGREANKRHAGERDGHESFFLNVFFFINSGITRPARLWLDPSSAQLCALCTYEKVGVCIRSPRTFIMPVDELLFWPNSQRSLKTRTPKSLRSFGLMQILEATELVGRIQREVPGESARHNVPGASIKIPRLRFFFSFHNFSSSVFVFSPCQADLR